jgi:hypothetical protein
MNLQEQSIRMIRRRTDLLDKYIKSTYNWLNPKAFKDFDEFIERVVFSTVRDITSMELNINDYDELLKVRNDITKHVEDIVNTKYRDEIKKYYDRNK